MEEKGPPPPYYPPRVSQTIKYLSVENAVCRVIATILGFACMLLSVFASKADYNPTLPVAICLPLMWWGITGRPDAVDIHFMRYRNNYSQQIP